jgi:hypothetical protein
LLQGLADWLLLLAKKLAEIAAILTAWEYLDYNRRDVLATWELHLKLIAEWNRHPFAPVPTPTAHENNPEALLITRAYSPASLAKGYLRAMGVRPRLQHDPDFPPNVLGWR